MFRMIAVLKRPYNFLKRIISRAWSRLKLGVDRHPMGAFLGVLAALVVMIAIGHQLRKPPQQAAAPVVAPKEVQTFQLASAPEIEVQAKIEKSGVIKLVAQTAGVVQKIKKTEGSHVKRGTVLLALSTNYQGANASSVSRQLASKNYQFLVDNFDTQKDVIAKQRDVANKAETQASELRAIARQSVGETNSLITLDEDIISILDKQIEELEATNVGGANDALILQSKQAKAGTLAGLNMAKSAVRNTEYQSSDDQEPAELARLQRDITLKQLDVQEKMLTLNKDVAKLSVRLAQINESLMYPASPCPGTVERIYVKVGQAVTPGTVLASIRGDMNEATAVALVSGDVAENISMVNSSQMIIGSQKVVAFPRSIAKEPTDGSLHAVLYSVPETAAGRLSDGEYVTIKIPVGMASSTKFAYVPLDAIFQTENEAYVYVAVQEGDKLMVRNRSLKLGQVYGRYVEVLEGLQPGDKVIINRNVVEGETVIAYAAK